jgi:hypothetical protein
MPFRRTICNRFTPALLLALTLVHVAPSGVIVCASERGLRYEFSCGCSETKIDRGCNCGNAACGTTASAAEDTGAAISNLGCVCTDHNVNLAAARAARTPQPQIADAPAVEPAAHEFMAVREAVRVARIVEYTGSPPPLLATVTVVLLI